MPADLLTRESRNAYLRLARLDLEDHYSPVSRRQDMACGECGDAECDGEAHWDEADGCDYCPDCGQCQSCSGSCECGGY